MYKRVRAPDNSIIAAHPTERCDDKARYLFPRRFSSLLEGPVFVQEKAIDCPNAIGERIKQQKRKSCGGGEYPQQEIQDNNVEYSIQATHNSKFAYLPNLLPQLLPTRWALWLLISSHLPGRGRIVNFGRLYQRRFLQELDGEFLLKKSRFMQLLDIDLSNAFFDDNCIALQVLF